MPCLAGGNLGNHIHGDIKCFRVWGRLLCPTGQQANHLQLTDPPAGPERLIPDPILGRIDHLDRNTQIRVNTAGDAFQTSATDAVMVERATTASAPVGSVTVSPPPMTIRLLCGGGGFGSDWVALLQPAIPARRAITKQARFVIPSGAPKARSRGIAIVPLEGPLFRDDGDSSDSGASRLRSE